MGEKQTLSFELSKVTPQWPSITMGMLNSRIDVYISHTFY